MGIKPGRQADSTWRELNLLGKESTCNAGDVREMFYPWVGKISWRRTQQPTPVLFPGETSGQRSLAACSPQGHKRSTWLKQHSMHSLSSLYYCSRGRMSLCHDTSSGLLNHCSDIRKLNSIAFSEDQLLPFLCIVQSLKWWMKSQLYPLSLSFPTSNCIQSHPWLWPLQWLPYWSVWAVFLHLHVSPLSMFTGQETYLISSHIPRVWSTEYTCRINECMKKVLKGEQE